MSRVLREFGEGGGVDAGVLADVEGLEVEAVGADFEEEGVDEELGEAVAVVLFEALAEDGEVGEEFGGAGVGGERGGAGRGGAGAFAEAGHHAGDEEADALVGEAADEGVLGGGGAGDADLVEVAVEECGEGGGDGDLLGGAGELLEDVFEAMEVVAEDQIAGHGEGGGGGFGGDEGVAVAVAADPGAEGDEEGEVGEGGDPGFGELLGEGVADFGVEDGDGCEEGGLVVVEGHAHLVADAGAGGADVVGLPEGGDLGEQGGLEGCEFGGGSGMRSRRSRRSEMRRRLNMTERRATSVGWAVKTGVMQMWARRSRAWGRVGPESLRARRVPRREPRWIVRRRGFQLMGEAAALAVVGFGEVDELEVKGEGACKLIGAGGIVGFGGERGRVGVGIFAAKDGGLAESLDRLVDTGGGLLAEDLAEQGAEGADVAAERCGFEVAGGGEEFGEAVGPGGRIPQGRHE